MLPLCLAPRPEARALQDKAQRPGKTPELYRGLRAGHKTAFRVSSKSQFNVFSNKTKGRNTWYLLSTQALVLKINQRVRRDLACDYFRIGSSPEGGAAGKAAVLASASASRRQGSRRTAMEAVGRRRTCPLPRGRRWLPAPLAPPPHLRLSGDASDSCDQTGHSLLAIHPMFLIRYHCHLHMTFEIS